MDFEPTKPFREAPSLAWRIARVAIVIALAAFLVWFLKTTPIPWRP